MTLLLALFGIFLSGVLSGLLGVGGGLLIVPIFTLLLGREIHVAIATSLAVIIPTAIAGACFHWAHARVDMKLFLVCAGFAVVGGIVGAWLAGSVSPTFIRRLFAVLLLVVAVRMFFQS